MTALEDLNLVAYTILFRLSVVFKCLYLSRNLHTLHLQCYSLFIYILRPHTKIAVVNFTYYISLISLDGG
jgi:hypothetical protein